MGSAYKIGQDFSSATMLISTGGLSILSIFLLNKH
jgi:hypothetical protein